MSALNLNNKKRKQLHPPKKKLIVIFLILIVISIIGGLAYAYFKKTTVKTLDQFPVMLINNGKVAVYQEVRVSADGIEKEIVVSSLGSDSKDTKIYEVIPKEVAQKASDLEFSVKPTIIEDDPIILWDLPSMHDQVPSRFSYKTSNSLGISKSSSSKTKPYCTQKPEIVQAMKKLKYDPENWDDCDFYVTAFYKAAVDKNKQLREEREKDQVQIIQPGEAKYSEIQQQAKKVIQAEEKKITPIPASGLPYEVKNKVQFCKGDSDCKNNVCENCSAGREICVKGNCLNCTYDGHCKDGYVCRTDVNICVSKQSITPAPAKAAGSCQDVNLAEGAKTYYFYKSASPCSGYSRGLSVSRFSVRCNQASAQWREHYVKEVSTQGASKLRIKASLGLKDYAAFFGTGVKSADYVDLMVFSSDPNPTLSGECNRAVSEADWSKCGISNTSSLGHCGVPANSEGTSCDFSVQVAGLNKVYLILRVADAWLADVEGSLSNLKVCPE